MVSPTYSREGTSGLGDITMECVFGDSQISEISENVGQTTMVIDGRLGFGKFL